MKIPSDSSLCTNFLAKSMCDENEINRATHSSEASMCVSESESISIHFRIKPRGIVRIYI